MKQYISPLLRVFTVVALAAIIYQQNKTIEDLRSLNNQAADSLASELFVTDIELTRYQTALELLREVDSVAADKFDLILTTQTE